MARRRLTLREHFVATLLTATLATVGVLAASFVVQSTAAQPVEVQCEVGAGAMTRTAPGARC